MILRNLTPHPITIRTDSDSLVLPVYGPAPRLAPSRLALRHVYDCGPDGHASGDGLGVRLVRTTLGDPDGLPERIGNVILIVSALVAEHPSVAGRDDLAYPGEAVRDADGRIVACLGLCAGPGLARRYGQKESRGHDGPNQYEARVHTAATVHLD